MPVTRISACDDGPIEFCRCELAATGKRGEIRLLHGRAPFGLALRNGSGILIMGHEPLLQRLARLEAAAGFASDAARTIAASVAAESVM